MKALDCCLSALRNIPIFILFIAGLWPFSASAQPGYIPFNKHRPGVMVFVHGFTGDDIGTWTNVSLNLGPRSQPYWPRIVANDAAFDAMDVFVASYRTKLIRDIVDIDNLVPSVMKQLEEVFSSHQYVVFVSHSLGGIVTRKLLLANKKKLLPKVRALFLFAVPTEGSKFAVIAAPFNLQARQIMTNRVGSYLDSLNESWINEEGVKFKSYCAYEKKPTIPIPFVGIVVKKSSSSGLCIGALEGVDATHITIVKPRGLGDKRHELLRNWFWKVFPEEYDTSTALSETGYKVAVANCTTSSKYSSSVDYNIIQQIKDAGFQARVTRRLPGDWENSYKNLLWTETAPDLIVIHLSCFQQGGQTDEEYKKRTDRFIKFLNSLVDDQVKVIVYSKAFDNQSEFKFLKRYIGDKTGYKFEKRLIYFPVSHERSLGTNKETNKRFRDTIKRVLT